MSGSINSATSSAVGSAASSASRFSGDLDTFLKLLTTQLQNQDPTSPMDADKLTEQLVQFSTVEQQINTNSTLQQLLALQQASQLGEAAALVGRRVAVETDRLPLQSGLAEVNLPAAGTSTIARIEIRDASGILVRSSDVTLGTGASTWQWDGTNSRGVQQPDGTYRVTVSGRTPDGVPEIMGFTVNGLVTGAVRDQGVVTLRMGGLNVGYDALRNLSGGI
ncbi:MULTISPECIES: flagellar hook assembly protein FlgD [Roseomonadaceae]|uniref:Basal-body rod modification protein FlgD n=1 Tax=Falsiroseomonas oleicola TaxID=2801474 RepID=A0ABS6HFY8_9PROT|nr:flagellar hook assembly protein FlgD [Roseomonas oleicola]MBU8546416.1 flagellar hook assembly protein FlgD [Roseomonas oleicola]